MMRLFLGEPADLTCELERRGEVVEGEDASQPVDVILLDHLPIRYLRVELCDLVGRHARRIATTRNTVHPGERLHADL